MGRKLVGQKAKDFLYQDAADVRTEEGIISEISHRRAANKDHGQKRSSHPPDNVRFHGANIKRAGEYHENEEKTRGAPSLSLAITLGYAARTLGNGVG